MRRATTRRSMREEQRKVAKQAARASKANKATKASKATNTADSIETAAYGRATQALVDAAKSFEEDGATRGESMQFVEDVLAILGMTGSGMNLDRIRQAAWNDEDEDEADAKEAEDGQTIASGRTNPNLTANVCVQELCQLSMEEGIAARNSFAQRVIHSGMSEWPASASNKPIRYRYQHGMTLPKGAVKEFNNRAPENRDKGIILVRDPQPFDALFYYLDDILAALKPHASDMLQMVMMANNLRGSVGLRETGTDPQVIAHLVLGEITEVAEGAQLAVFTNIEATAVERELDRNDRQERRQDNRRTKSERRNGPGWDRTSSAR